MTAKISHRRAAKLALTRPHKVSRAQLHAMIRVAAEKAR